MYRRPSGFFLSIMVSILAVTVGCKVAGDLQSETGLFPNETGDEDPSGDGDGDPSGDGDGDADACTDQLDILVVMDNSGSMADAQLRFVLATTELVGLLDAAGLDWRIGITTSDNGNPWCPAGTTTPEGGKLVLESCTTRLGDFLFGNNVDVQDELCNDLCPNDNFTITNTTTTVDPSPQPRPWIERTGGQGNVSGVSVEEALRCVIPMGVNGCGFESQLESGYVALTRAGLADEESYGFLRKDASLLVLIVSDEADCSYNSSEIFEADGSKTFWSDPTAPYPTSAVCWNAGVQCTGDPSNYSSCDPENFDINGAPTDRGANSVLEPISRYTSQLDEIEGQRTSVNPGARVRLAVVGGVGLDGTPHYADTTDLAFQDSFGIGPGCEDAGSSMAAVPPVRMRDVALASGGPLGSICAPDYSPFLSQLVESFVAGCD
jgi:hypothetical protein